MNNTTETEIRLRLLKILSRESNLTQRDMARQVGVSLGKVNFCLTELAQKGLIKIKHFRQSSNKLAYRYLLTPVGMEEKAKLTIGFLKRKLQEYEEIERQIRELSREVDAADLRTIFKENGREVPAPGESAWSQVAVK